MKQQSVMTVEHGVKSSVRGAVELFQVIGDEWIPTWQRKNVILNSGMDLAARALAGQIFINGVYLAFDNLAPPFSDSTPATTRTAAFYHSDGGGTRNFIRVPTLAVPDTSATTAAYNTNKAAFTAISAGAGELVGAGNQLVDSSSEFYGAALSWLDPAGKAGDILFSAIDFDDVTSQSHFTKLPGAEFGIRWSIWFEL